MGWVETPHERNWREFNKNARRANQAAEDRNAIFRDRERRFQQYDDAAERSRKRAERQARGDRRVETLAFLVDSGAHYGSRVWARARAATAAAEAAHTRAAQTADANDATESADDFAGEQKHAGQRIRTDATGLAKLSPLAISSAILGALFFLAPFSSVAAIGLGTAALVRTRGHLVNPWERWLPIIGIVVASTSLIVLGLVAFLGLLLNIFAHTL